MTVWLISDTHFGETALIGADAAPGKEARPFASVAEMDACLADHWCDCIAPGDTVLHLGDVCAPGGGQMLPRLPGRKHLILGNHDDPTRAELRAAFETIAVWNVKAAPQVALTHLPLQLDGCAGLTERFALNIHGHLHARPAPSARHICVSVEQTGFAPVNLEDLLARQPFSGASAPSLTTSKTT